MSSQRRTEFLAYGAAALLAALGMAACKKKAAPPKPAPAAAAPSPAPAAKAAAPSASSATVAVSTPPAPPAPTVSMFYKADRARDIFIPLTGAGAGIQTTIGVVVSSEAFSIHNLELRGVLDAPAGQFALIVDPNTGASFVLKAGRLIDAKGKTVPGVFGTIKGKKVRLMTADKDVQDLKMGAESAE